MPTLVDQYQLILIFAAVIIGVISATHFYQSTDAFPGTLRRSLRTIVWGLAIMALDVLLAAFIMYESKMDVRFTLLDIPLEAYFFILYIIGSIFVFNGARRLISRPRPQTL